METVKKYLDSYLKERNEKIFFECLHQNCQCYLIRNTKEVSNTKQGFIDMLKNRHFAGVTLIENIEIRKLEETENNKFNVHIVSHQTNKGVKYEINDRQTYQIDPETNLIIFIKHDWVVDEIN